MRPHQSSIVQVIPSVLVLLATGCAHKQVTEYQGYVEGRFVYVASPESGRLDYLSVARGETVDAGHALFRLDDEPEASLARQALRALRASESRLADLQTGKRQPEIEVTRARLMQVQVEKRQTERILSSNEAQYRAGGIPQTELINAQAAADSSAARVRELEAQLAVDSLPAREQQIRAQENQAATDRARLAEAEWKLHQKQVSSTRKGVVFDTLYREGEWVAAGNPVVQLLPPENLEVRFFVPDSVVGKLRTGEHIRVVCDGCAEMIPAVITFISPQCEYTPPVIYSNENRSKLMFMIIAKPPVEKAPILHPGQPVTVTFP